MRCRLNIAKNYRALVVEMTAWVEREDCLGSAPAIECRNLAYYTTLLSSNNARDDSVSSSSIYKCSIAEELLVLLELL